ncbi:HIT family protein [Dictyobacter formicarum]|uniref:HIT family protein n=1 Tax=Dictyobacter formicarum TaxID=2778368 RepID=A0ABQ3VI08_9CHLR|nr:HIT family protein [Dictyobacter formicarum]GHO85820.1 HIT family protein [Dictyobacter formicarum]
MTKECLFCAIVAGTEPASLVYQDEIVSAFLTIGPVNPGHLLVIPNQHAAFLSDMDEETGAHLFTISTRLARVLRQSGLRCEGINLFLADREAAFQEIFHVHMHVFPRFSGDNFTISADWSVKPSRAELDRIALQIRQGAVK